MHYALHKHLKIVIDWDDIDDDGDGDDDGRRSPLKPGKDDSQGDSRAGPDRRTRRPLHMLNLVVGSIYTSSFGKSLSKMEDEIAWGQGNSNCQYSSFSILVLYRVVGGWLRQKIIIVHRHFLED